ncbi:MAG: 50S ribosomal protein L24, partial [Mucispirillum sp.]|nr:50S ribosomal protein L24 [Mucispirillum sp.]
MYLCNKCGKGVRLGIKILDNGKKARFCKSCGEVVDK